MANFNMLMLKMIKAIRLKYGQVLLLKTEQKVSEESGRVYTEYSVSLSMLTEEYNRMFPKDPKNPHIHKSKYASLLLKRTPKVEEMFLYLLNEIWRKLESGEMDEQGKRFAEAVRSGRYVRKGKRGSGGKGVLQKSQVREELPGGISGGKQFGSDKTLSGDIGEA